MLNKSFDPNAWRHAIATWHPAQIQAPASNAATQIGPALATAASPASTTQTAAQPDGWHFANDAWKWGPGGAGNGAGGGAGGGAGDGAGAGAGGQHTVTPSAVAGVAEPYLWFGGGNDGTTGASGPGDAGAASDGAAAAAAGTGDGFARGGFVRAQPPRNGMSGGHPPRGLRSMAQHVARQGRGDDTSLVHMTPDEIRGLSRLAPGGRLPINPRTGYPEAGILSAILGIAGGIGGSFIGMPWLGAGLGSLGGGLLEGKDFGTALTGGILSGLGGYGLGQAAGMLGEAGGSAASEAAAQMAKNGVQAAPLAESAASASGDIHGQLAAASSGGVPSSVASAPASMANPMTMQQWGDKAANVAQGATDPSALWKTFGENARQTTLPIGLSLYGQSMMNGQPQQGQPYVPQQQGNYPTLPGPNKRKYIPAPANWDYSTGKEWNYFTPAFAMGGPIPPAGGQGFGGRPGRSASPPQSQMQSFIANRPGPPGPQMQSFIDNRAAAGQPQPQMQMQMQRPTGQMPIRQMPPQQMAPQQMPMQGNRFADGGGVYGAGSGLDDAIPAVINGRQPAKLSSGEFVVPSHAVSALGNGSTEDGVRHLNGMVNQVMMQKYGTANRKPRPINPHKVMPR